MDGSVIGMMAGIVGLALGLAALMISGNLSLKLNALRLDLEDLRSQFSKDKKTIRKE